MNRFRLFGTSACHLCEIAEQMLERLVEAGMVVPYDKVDIADSDELFERYGLLIPVLKAPGGKELCWPFDEVELRGFIAAGG